MELEELLKAVKEEHSKLLKKYNFKDNKEMRYPVMVKIMEELGELSEAVLTYDSLQRKDKLENNNTELEGEIADVLLTTLILAENLNVDVKQALINKIKKLKERHK